MPNGRILGSRQYICKLEWLVALRDAAHTWLANDPQAQIALVGDWNIAPTDEDVWSVEFYKDGTYALHVSARRSTQSSMLNSPMWYGLSRSGVYTYWDYTQLRFPKNCGMRIDFILGWPALVERVTHAEIVREERKGKAPSDTPRCLWNCTSRLTVN